MVMNEAPASQCCERASGFGCTFEESQSASIHTELADPTSSYRRGHAAASLVHFVEEFFKPSDTSGRGPGPSSGVWRTRAIAFRGGLVKVMSDDATAILSTVSDKCSPRNQHDIRARD